MSESKIVKAKQKYHFNRNKKRSNIDVNYKGFLCSCNNREKDCVKETYNILNKYADSLYSTSEKNVSIENAEEKSPEHLEIEDEISKEVQSLKSKTERPRFQLVDAGAKNMVFIRTTLPNPAELAKHIASEIYNSKKQETRFLIRLVPIETTCKAYVKDIVNAFEPLAEKYFKGDPQTFSIVYNHRHNNSLSRDDVIKAVADKVATASPDHKVNLKEAEVSVVIEIIKGFAYIGVVSNFIKYKKYNLLALAEDKIDENASAALEDEDTKTE